MTAIWAVWKAIRLFAGLAMIATLIALALHFAPAVYSNGEGGHNVTGASWGTVGILAAIAVGLWALTIGLQILFGVLYGDREDEF